MADQVQYELEAMLPELDELLHLDIFSKVNEKYNDNTELCKVEIKSIVKKRTNFEYLLRRKKLEKADFLQYIEYEMALCELKRKRLERKKDVEEKNLQCVYTSIQRIHKLFTRAKQRFPNGTIKL